MFLKQNRTIAKSHSMLTLKVSQLEDRLSHFQTETYNLKTENFELNRVIREFEQDNTELQSHVQHLEQQLEQQAQKYQQNIQTESDSSKEIQNNTHQHCSPEVCGHDRPITTEMYQNIYKLNQKLGEAARIINSLNVSLSPNRRTRGSDQNLLFRESFSRQSFERTQSSSRTNSLSSVIIHRRHSQDIKGDDTTNNDFNNNILSFSSPNMSKRLSQLPIRPTSRNSSRRTSGFVNVSSLITLENSTHNEDITNSPEPLDTIVSSDGVKNSDLISSDSEVSSKDFDSLEMSPNNLPFPKQISEEPNKEGEIYEEEDIRWNDKERKISSNSEVPEINKSYEGIENVSNNSTIEHDNENEEEHETKNQYSDSEEDDEYDSCIPEEEEVSSEEISLVQDNIQQKNNITSESSPKNEVLVEIKHLKERECADVIDLTDSIDSSSIEIDENCDQNSRDFQGVTFRRSKQVSRKVCNATSSSVIPIHQDLSLLTAHNIANDCSPDIALKTKTKLNNSVILNNSFNSKGNFESDNEAALRSSVSFSNNIAKLGQKSQTDIENLTINISSSFSKEVQQRVDENNSNTDQSITQNSLRTTNVQPCSNTKARRTKRSATSSRRAARSAASPASAKRPSPNETETMPETLSSLASISNSVSPSSFNAMIPRRPRRSCSKNISYTLPSLSTKLRKEVNSNFDAVVTETDIITAAAASESISNKRKRRVTSEKARKKKSLDSQSDPKLDCRKSTDTLVQVVPKSLENTPTKKSVKRTKTSAVGKENIDPSSDLIIM